MPGDFVVSGAGSFYGQRWCALLDGVEADELAGGEEWEEPLAALAALRPKTSVAPTAAAATAVPMRDFGILTLISLFARPGGQRCHPAAAILIRLLPVGPPNLARWWVLPLNARRMSSSSPMTGHSIRGSGRAAPDGAA
jgi:hypothetical protein